MLAQQCAAVHDNYEQELKKAPRPSEVQIHKAVVNTLLLASPPTYAALATKQAILADDKMSLNPGATYGHLVEAVAELKASLPAADKAKKKWLDRFSEALETHFFARPAHLMRQYCHAAIGEAVAKAKAIGGVHLAKVEPCYADCFSNPNVADWDPVDVAKKLKSEFKGIWFSGGMHLAAVQAAIEQEVNRLTHHSGNRDQAHPDALPHYDWLIALKTQLTLP